MRCKYACYDRGIHKDILTGKAFSEQAGRGSLNHKGRRKSSSLCLLYVSLYSWGYTAAFAFALLIELTLHTKRKLQRAATGPDSHLPPRDPGPFRALNLRRALPKGGAGRERVTWNAQCSRCALGKSASEVERGTNRKCSSLENKVFHVLGWRFLCDFPSPYRLDHPQQQQNRVPKTTEGGADDTSFRGSQPRLRYTNIYLTSNALGVVNGRYSSGLRGRSRGAFVEVGSCNF